MASRLSLRARIPGLLAQYPQADPLRSGGRASTNTCNVPSSACAGRTGDARHHLRADLCGGSSRERGADHYADAQSAAGAGRPPLADLGPRSCGVHCERDRLPRARRGGRGVRHHHAALYLRHAWQRRLERVPNAGADELDDAIREGAVLRVRPKAMTVAVTLAGLFPIFIGAGAASEVMQRIAAPMVGGMITAPLLSMRVVPAAYRLLQLRAKRRLALSPASPAGGSF
jgi:hypothetical protein